MRAARLGDADPRTLKAAALLALATSTAGDNANARARFARVRAQARDTVAATEIEELLTNPELVLGPRLPRTP